MAKPFEQLDQTDDSGRFGRNETGEARLDQQVYFDRPFHIHEDVRKAHEETRALLDDVELPQQTYETSEAFRAAFHVPENAQLTEPQRVTVQALEDILCGREKVSKAELRFARQFAETFFAPVPAETSDYKKSSALGLLKDIDSTAALQKYMNAPGRSPVQPERTRLGITVGENEQPYELCVVSLSGPDAEKRQAIWEEVSEGSEMFILNAIFKDGLKRTPTIYLSAKQANSILFNNRPDFVEALRHEYRHTQRNSLQDPQGKLFQFLDEAMTSIEGQYMATRVVLRLLTTTTSDLTREDLLNAHESTDQKMKAEVLQKWTNAFGPQGLLLLGASNHAEDPRQISEEFEQMPLVDVGTNNKPIIAYVETLLAYREKNEVNWREVFAKNLQNPQFALGSLQFLFNPVLLELSHGIDETSAERFKDMVKMVEREIARREALEKLAV